MRVELLTIGDELLLGFTIDTNAAYLARALAALGVEIVRRGTVGDRAEDIASGVREALDRTGAVSRRAGSGPPPTIARVRPSPRCSGARCTRMTRSWPT